MADAKQNGLDANTAPEAYPPFADDVQNNVDIVIRSATDESLMATWIREQAGAAACDLAATDIRPAAELLSGSTKQERFRTSLLAVFAAMALLLAAIGIYGVAAYLVTPPTREIRIMAPGVAAGLTGAYLCARWIRTVLFGVEAVNPAI